jgi:hypothetical protein
MDSPIRTKSTSRSSAEVDWVTLRETGGTRLLFRPILVDNPHDQEAAVRGTFVHQRKKPSGVWEDYAPLQLTKLRDAEWVKLELRSEEVLKLFGELQALYAIVGEHGVPFGDHEFVPLGGNLKRLIREPGFAERLLSDAELDLVAAFVRWMASNQNEALQRLEADITASDLGAFDTLLATARLRQFDQTFHANAGNQEESFWQGFFKENSWVLARLFAHPFVLVEDQVFLGGKTITNRGGSLADFLYANQLTGNVLVVEIKTPTTKLLAREYRNRVFPISNDLAGAITQALHSRRTLIEQYKTLREEGESWAALSPRCLVLAGSIRHEKMTPAQKSSFELFRNSLRDLDLVTFDELAEQVSRLIALTAEA